MTDPMQPPRYPESSPTPRGRTAARALLVAGFLTLCLQPYLAWARYPSLFDDDLTRVGGFRRLPFAAALWRPFNEHVAPLFEVVGWLAWWGSGRRVEAVATGFLVASYVAWSTTLVGLGLVVRRELRSPLAAGVALAIFAAAPVAAETVLWYSASSFQWAAAAGLAAWYAALRAFSARSGRSRAGWLVAAGAGALASPLFSAIGVLAGPLAALRLVAAENDEGQGGGGPRSGAGRVGCAAVPLLGTVAYGLLVTLNRAGGGAVAASVRGHLDPVAALWAAVRAPVAVLVPGILGSPGGSAWVPDPVAAVGTVALIGGAMCWARRSRARGLIVVGLGWIVGGYLLAYATRARPGDRWVLEVGRYHLFPLIGGACWTAAAVGPMLDRLERKSPLAGWGVLVSLAALGVIRGGARVDEIARRSFRYPDQGAQVAAALRLEAACRASGVSLEQAIRIVDPVEPRWFPRPLPFHPLLYLFDTSLRGDRHPDPEAVAAVLTLLTAEDREAIFGGVDAGRYADLARPATSLSLEPTRSGLVAPIGEGRLYHEELTWPADRGDPLGLRLTGIAPGVRVEVWWAGADGIWSPGRSVRWTTTDPSPRLALTRLPHWRPGFARRFRVVRRGWPLPASDRPIVTIDPG